ncbi:MAG TPA: helix-turn-helix domain-containing protein [Acidimicrobiales bacterium]|nr:helix-turn-helix domain-containing protein [Acidimicrobiales bacterium]
MARASRTELLDELFGARGAPETLAERLLRTSDVATLFQVSERTVSEWGRRGRIPSVRTPSGHRRYPATAIKDLLVEASEGAPDRP